MKKLQLLIYFLFMAFIVYSQNVDSFIDTRDGKTYKTIQIGDQVWMAENLSFKSEGNCWAYDDNPENVVRYGYLYDWETAKTVCPEGWRLPTKEDFKVLLDNVGSKGKIAYQALIIGGTSGFSAAFGGWREKDKKYKNIDQYCLFWSSDLNLSRNAYYLSIDGRYKIAGVFAAGLNRYGYSVRCVKNN
ncbi:MAG: FISUMP domain-containing protein [Bacteroidales bacterium]